ncbi:hypothetical protein YC2023_071501 [Brassica napus]
MASCNPRERWGFKSSTSSPSLLFKPLEKFMSCWLFNLFNRKKTATKECPEISQGLLSFHVQHEEISWRKKAFRWKVVIQERDGGFGNYLFGMSDVVAKQSAEANTPLNIKNLHLIMIVDFKLTYPSGTATAHHINSFHTPQGAKLTKYESFDHDPFP